MKPLFSLGRVATTAVALRALGPNGLKCVLIRHQSGDWGVVHREDKIANDAAIRSGRRVMSVYTLPSGVTIWVVTRGDRSLTKVLVPDE